MVLPSLNPGLCGHTYICRTAYHLKISSPTALGFRVEDLVSPRGRCRDCVLSCSVAQLRPTCVKSYARTNLRGLSESSSPYLGPLPLTVHPRMETQRHVEAKILLIESRIMEPGFYGEDVCIESGFYRYSLNLDPRVF